jgi:hypothetical protein
MTNSTLPFGIKMYEGWTLPAQPKIDETALNKKQIIDTLDPLVYRNFNRGDRVKIYFKDEWYSGTVVAKYKSGFMYPKKTIEWSKKVFGFGEKSYCVNSAPQILVKTDLRVENSEGYFNGFGLTGFVDLHQLIAFEDEPVDPNPLKTGYEIYRKRPFVRKRTYKDDPDWLPF